MTKVKQIQVIPSEVGTSSTTGSTSLRGTYANLPQNANLIKCLQKITEGVFEGSSNLFADGNYDKIDNIVELQKFLTQVIIRFDNNPDYYTKRDYQYLIALLYRSLLYLYETNSGSQENTFNVQVTDEVEVARFNEPTQTLQIRDMRPRWEETNF